MENNKLFSKRLASSAVIVGLAFSASSASAIEWSSLFGFAKRSKTEVTEGAGAIAKEGGEARDKDFVPLSELSKFPDALNKATTGLFVDIEARVKAAAYLPVIDADKTVNDLVVHLDNSMNKVVAIEGDKGVGKTQSLYGLQLQIEQGDVPAWMQGAKVVEINTDAMIESSAAQIRTKLGELKHRLAKGQAVIIGIPNLGFFTEANNAQEKRILERLLEDIRQTFEGEAKVVLMGSKAEVSKLVQLANLGGIARMTLKGASEPKMIRIGMAIADRMQKEDGTSISEITIERAVRWSNQYLSEMGSPKSIIYVLEGAKAARNRLLMAKASPLSLELREELKDLQQELVKMKALTGDWAARQQKTLPDKIASLEGKIKQLDARFDSLKVKQAEWNEIRERAKRGKPLPGDGERWKELVKEVYEITDDDVAVAVALHSERPLAEILTRGMSVAEFKDKLLATIKGQPQIIEPLMRLIERYEHEFRLGNRPVGSVIMVGPPGTGKTQVMNLIGEFLDGLVMFRGSEFTQAHSNSSLIGAAPGYVGFDKFAGARMIDPFANGERKAMGWDELDQFHDEALKLLYPLLQEGKGTAQNGVEANYHWMFWMGTTNAGYKDMKVGMSREKKIEILLNYPGKRFQEAMLSRVDEILVFQSLDKPALRQIAERFLNDLNNLVRAKHKNLEWTDAVKDKLVEPLMEEGNDAREFVRTFENMIQDDINRISRYGRYFNEVGHPVEVPFKEGDTLVIDISSETGKPKYSIKH